MKTYSRKRNTSLNRFFEMYRRNRRPFLTAIVVIAIVVVSIIGISYAFAQRNFSASIFVANDTIKIGLRTDLPGFGQVDEAGTISGFDKDFIEEVLDRMLGGQEKLIEFIPITSQNAGSNIKYGITNMNLGLVVEGTARVKGFRITRPYYMDRVVAVVPGTSRIDKLANMGGGKLGIFSASMPEQDLKDYLEKNKMTYELLRYSDYESAMTDIEQGRINAVIMPYTLARQFETTGGFRILAEPLYEVGYSVMLPTGQVAFANEMNKVINQMENDGTLQELYDKWEL